MIFGGLEILAAKFMAGKIAAAGAAKMGAGAVAKTAAVAAAKATTGTAMAGHAKHQIATSVAHGAVFPQKSSAKNSRKNRK